MSPRSSTKAKSSGRGKTKAKSVAAHPDVYVGLLFVSVACLIAGISFLVVELYRYQWLLPGQ